MTPGTILDVASVLWKYLLNWKLRRLAIDLSLSLETAPFTQTSWIIGNKNIHLFITSFWKMFIFFTYLRQNSHGPEAFRCSVKPRPHFHPCDFRWRRSRRLKGKLITLWQTEVKGQYHYDLKSAPRLWMRYFGHGFLFYAAQVSTWSRG